MCKAFQKSLLMILLVSAVSATAYQRTEYHLGGAYDRVRYSEANMDEKGWLPGGYFGVKWVFDYPYALNARIDYYNGNLKYNGSTFSGTPVLDNSTKDWIRNIEVMGDVRAGAFTFHMGLGERVWFNDLVISYTRRTTYYYLPVGFTWEDPSGFYLKALQNFFLVGYNVSTLSSVSHTPPYGDVMVPQRVGNGWSAEIGWRDTSHPAVNLELAAYYKEWHVNDSESESTGGTSVIEPKNKTDILGFNLGIVF